MKHLRAYRGTDTALTLWVRNDAGKRDMSALTVTLAIRAYGQTSDALTSVAATTPEDGKVLATLTAATADDILGPGLFRVDAVADEDGETLASAVLEVV